MTAVGRRQAFLAQRSSWRLLSWPQPFKNSNKLNQHFIVNVFFFYSTVFSVVLCPGPHPCRIKNSLVVHFKGFSIIKGSVSLGWKLSLFIQTFSAIPSRSERSSADDTCSNHWVMSHLMLSSTSKVPRWDAEMLKEAGGSREKQIFLDWLCRGGEENVWHFLLCSAVLFFLFFLKTSRIQGGLCNCSLPLIRWHPVGIKRSTEKDFIYIFMCTAKSWGSQGRV